MKSLQILLLLGAGVLGGALVTRVWQRPRPQAPAHVLAAPPVVQQPAAPQPAVDTVPLPLPPAKPSPVAALRETPRTRLAHAVPPPANPRPVDLGAKVEPASPPPVVQAEAAAPAPVPAPPPARPEPEPEHVTPAPPAALAPEPHKVTLNAGMLIPVRLVDGLSSERNAPGDPFSATLDRELAAEGFVIAERGARVEGRVVTVDRAAKTRGTTALAVEITRIHTSDGQTVTVQTDRFERRAEPNRQEDAAKIGGGAIIGAVIGGMAGGGKGAAIGAGVGGGAGAGGVLLTSGKPATLPSETRISFRLRAPVTLTERQ